MGGPGRPKARGARETRGTRPAPRTRGGARAAGARAGGEARRGPGMNGLEDGERSRYADTH